MEIAWLEDFLAVLDCGGFSRAAEARHITQSALSRRIRALEDWVGAPLFQRTTHSVTLSPAGAVFRLTAQDVLRRLEAGRAEAREEARGTTDTLKFAATNALSLTFFPDWLRQMEDLLPFVVNIQLVANHMEACERIMLRGQAQFLLCHNHPQVSWTLAPKHFRSAKIGEDELIPVSAPASDGDPRPLHALPGTEEAPVACLTFSTESGMGRIIAAVRATSPLKLHMKPVFASHLAKLLVTMALERRGMAFVPKSLVEDHLRDGRLVLAGDRSAIIPIEIHIFRPVARQSPVAEQFWAHATGRPSLPVEG